MRRILLFCLTAVFLLASGSAWAQERTVSGKVTSQEDGSGLPGVNVVVKGTTNGTVTDSNGSYSLPVPGGATTLVFSFIGLKSEEIEVGDRTSIDLQMTQDIQQLTEVVVTALNIPREKASLGYSTQTVSGDAVTAVKQQNFVNSLSGKIAGVQIRTAGQFGGSTNIVIRGNKSVSGNNQPLFVVDGVPIDNRTGNSTFQEAGRMGFDYGNSTSDINPEDIESINVLKGAGASVLYGSRAANGVIMITTKKGATRKGVGIQFSTGVTGGKVNKDTFIKYQKEYGAGYAAPSFGYYGPQGFFEDDVNGDGVTDLVVPTLEDGSYGAQFDPNLNVYHWDSFVKESPNFGKAYAWTAAANMPDKFFETQMEYNNSIALSGGSAGNTFRLGYTNYKANGFLPNAEQNRHTIAFTGTSKINSKLEATINANYVFADTKGRPSTGYGDNQMANFRQWWQTNVDMYSQRDIYEQTGRNITWNGGDYYDPETPIFWDNPYWTRYKNFQTDKRSRLFGNLMLNYKMNDWLSVMGRVSLDTYSELREERRAVGSVPTEFGLTKGDGTKNDEGSGYQRQDRAVSETNYDLFVSLNKDLSPDFNLSAMVGTNIRKQRVNIITTATNGGLVVPDLYSINNSALGVALPQETYAPKEVYGFLGNVNLGWKNRIYLEMQARRDVSSALPVENNAYNYISPSISAVISEMVTIPGIDFLKARVNYAEVGNDTDALNTINTYTKSDNFGEAVVFSFPTTVRNSNLLPEKTKSWEAGLEMRGVNNRLSLDLSVYKTNTVNQIITIETSKATGMGFKVINGGDIQNKGVEVSLGYDIVKNNALTWNARINWAKNISEVLDLGPVDNYVVQSYQGGVSANVTKGQPYGVLRSTGYQYLNGQRVVNASGYYVAVADQVIGDPNPDWTGGFMNTLTYKGFNLMFLIDISRGGDIFSLDMHYGQGTGLTENTAGNNELGNPIRNPVSEGGGFLNEGVQADGTPNTVRARADFYGGGFYWGNATRGPSSQTVYDAGYVKLREVALGYSLPKTFLPNVIQRASLSLVGRNLWIIDKSLPYADPESGLGAGNGQGYSSGAYPTLKNIGFKLDLTF
jgi:TonB-linked SusC/RagA family outer membrane protein